jgi:hypothetical protein
LPLLQYVIIYSQQFTLIIDALGGLGVYGGHARSKEQRAKTLSRLEELRSRRPHTGKITHFGVRVCNLVQYGKEFLWKHIKLHHGKKKAIQQTTPHISPLP